jgi:hypothetical protein
MEDSGTAATSRKRGGIDQPVTSKAQLLQKEFRGLYRNIKLECDFLSALAWLEADPTHRAWINSREFSPTGWTILHQAAYWGVGKPILERLHALGSVAACHPTRCVPVRVVVCRCVAILLRDLAGVGYM